MGEAKRQATAILVPAALIETLEQSKTFRGTTTRRHEATTRSALLCAALKNALEGAAGDSSFVPRHVVLDAIRQLGGECSLIKLRQRLSEMPKDLLERTVSLLEERSEIRLYRVRPGVKTTTREAAAALHDNGRGSWLLVALSA